MVSINGGPGVWLEIEREAATLRPPGFTPDLVPWGAGPDFHKFWIPEKMAPLAGSRVYGDLGEEQKLRYNQYCALQTIEKLIWIESYGITPTLVSLLTGDLPTPALRELLQSLLIDELNHTAAGWRLLRLAREDLYRKNKLFFFRPPPSVVRLATRVSRMPRLLSGWVFFYGSLEERLPSLCRESGNGIDPLFATVFALHTADEARHKRINALIAKWLVEPQGKLAGWINGRVMNRLSKAYRDTGWGGDGPILQLIKDFPELAQRKTQLIEETHRGRAGQEIPAAAGQLPEPPSAEASGPSAAPDGAILGPAEKISRVGT